MSILQVKFRGLLRDREVCRQQDLSGGWVFTMGHRSTFLLLIYVVCTVYISTCLFLLFAYGTPWEWECVHTRLCPVATTGVGCVVACVLCSDGVRPVDVAPLAPVQLCGVPAGCDGVPLGVHLFALFGEFFEFGVGGVLGLHGDGADALGVAVAAVVPAAVADDVTARTPWCSVPHIASGTGNSCCCSFAFLFGLCVHGL